MTETERRAHLRHIKSLARPERPGTATEHLWLLVPEGMEHDAEVMAECERLGANGVISPHPHWGTTPHHRDAHEAGHDVSRPVLWRPPPPRRELPARPWWRRWWDLVRAWLMPVPC